LDPSLFSLTSTEWVVVCLCAVLVGFAKTGISGAGILVVPIFADVFPAGESAGILLPMLCVGDIFAVIYYKRHAVWNKIWPLFPWVLLGIIVASIIRNELSTTHLRISIGIIVLSVLILSVFINKDRIEKSSEKTSIWLAGITGTSGGFATMLANAAGPIMNVYLILMKLPKNAFIGTGAWFFLLVNFFKIPIMVYEGSIDFNSVGFNAMLVPAIVVGALLGVRVVKVIPEKIFKKMVLVLTFIASVKLFF
jgi:uncharacterized protein